MIITNITYGIDGDVQEQLEYAFKKKKDREEMMKLLGLDYTGDFDNDFEQIEEKFDEDPALVEETIIKHYGYPLELEVPKKVEKKLTYFPEDDRYELMDYVQKTVKPKIEVIDIEFDEDYDFED